MKKTLMLMVMTLFLVSTIAMVSATEETYKTVVAGKIYDSPNFETANAVPGANVNVTCKGILKTTTSKSDGTYSVKYLPEEGCTNTNVTVVAEQGGIVSKTGTGAVQDYTAQFDLYLGVVNIALIPEFGLLIGALTFVSAVAVFFFVRKQ